MASITSDSKVTRSPSAATASKPPGSPQSQRGAAPSAPAASAASGFDPSSSFFPQALPGIDAPTASPQRVQSWRKWRKWLWPLAGLLLVGGGSLYYVQQQAQDRSVADTRSTRIPAVNAAPSAKAARPDGREGPQPTTQARITHTLPAGAPPAKTPSVRATQDTRLIAAPADNPAAELPAMDHTFPRVTHTQQ